MNMKQYLALSLVAIFMVMAGFGSIGVAQAATPLSCNVGSSSVGVNQNSILTASGGDGTYFWSGENLNITNSSGSQFSVSYPSFGTYNVTVLSAGQSAVCNINVVSTVVPVGGLACLPASQSLRLGQTATFSAVGGNGTYVWSSPDLSIINPNGSGFSASYASAGLKVMTVTSAGQTATCLANVSSRVVVNDPGFPNTGGGYGR